MAVIIENRQISPDVFLLEAVPDPGMPRPLPGQFYMLRTWDRYPLLSRPISVFDYDSDEGVIKFMYQVVGRGTEMLSQIAVSSNIMMDGPYGIGFPQVDSDVVLVGGGIGIAPLHYAAKLQKQFFPERRVRTYLGYAQMPFGIRYFEKVSDELTYDVGHFITDSVVTVPGEVVFCCGPEPMMLKVSEQIPAENKLYLSYESYMACGVGACLGCTKNVPINFRRREYGRGLELMETQNASVRICVDGPVFLRQVYH